MAIDEALMRDGAVDVEAFTAAARAGLPVGRCGCGSALHGAVDRGRGLVWLTTSCRSCGAERSSPGGRLLPRPPGERPAPRQWVLDAAAEHEARRFPDAA